MFLTWTEACLGHAPYPRAPFLLTLDLLLQQHLLSGHSPSDGLKLTYAPRCSNWVTCLNAVPALWLMSVPA